MVIGICSFTFMLYEGASLKEKRMIIKSITHRMRSRFNVSVAEVGEQEKWQRAVIGFSCVSNDRQHAAKMIQEILRFVEADGRGEVMSINQEII